MGKLWMIPGVVLCVEVQQEEMEKCDLAVETSPSYSMGYEKHLAFKVRSER